MNAEKGPLTRADSSVAGGAGRLGQVRYVDAAIMLALTAICLLIYLQLRSFAFINLDDNLYVYSNPHVTAGLNPAGVRWAMSSFEAANWHPLTWLSHMLDVSLFGVNPGRHHLVNLCLHTANTLLLFGWLVRLTGARWRSAIVALLFAVHPLHVESVAWIAERKDVLSTCFFLLLLIAYDAYVKRANAARYLLVLLLFALGLMAKPMLVTAPFVLLLLDFWPLARTGYGHAPGETVARNVKWLLLEKLPMFGMVAASSCATFLAQRAGGAVQPLQAIPLSLRLENAAVSYVVYLARTIWPSQLSVWYPFPTSIPLWQPLLALLVLASLTLLAVRLLKPAPYLLVGWLWFTGTLVPVIGLVQVGGQSHADRYMYIPHIGLFIALVWAGADVVKLLGFARAAVAAFCSAIILALALISFNQVRLWRNSGTLFRNTLAVTQNNWLIHHNLCSYLFTEKRYGEAEAECRSALAINGSYSNAYNTLGVVLAAQGKGPEALLELEHAVAYDPQSVLARFNYASLLARSGHADEAMQQLDAVHRLDQSMFARNADQVAALYVFAAAAYVDQQRTDDAISALRLARAMAPASTEVMVRLGGLLAQKGELVEALSYLRAVVARTPDSAEAHNSLGSALLLAGNTDEAITEFNTALRLKPDYPSAAAGLKSAQAVAQRRK